jgi:hypothetical protein
MEGFEYKKITKYDVNFPAYCYFFIKKLTEYGKCVKKPDDRLEVEIITSIYPYCYDAFELIIRTMERKGISIRLPSFKREKKEGKEDILRYKFTLKKLKAQNIDDLPF